jgi:UDP-N-acetylmuramoyl-tripeptide--D-alanyl-D-alanine ligase
MKSVQAVAEEHAALIDVLGSEDTAVFNADDGHSALWRQRAGARRAIGFGLEDGEVRGEYRAGSFGGPLILSTPWGRIDTTLGVPGRHNALNACGAAAACLAAGVPPDAVGRGLASFSGVKGRLQRRQGKRGALVIDDTYNANPDSMRAAVDVLSAIPGRRIFVMGDMGEVGDAAGQMHDEIGGYAKSHGVDRLFCLGDLSPAAARNFGSGGEHFTRIDELIRTVKSELGEQVTVLVKGSRFMRMERVADAIVEEGVIHAA